MGVKYIYKRTGGGLLTVLLGCSITSEYKLSREVCLACRRLVGRWHGVGKERGSSTCGWQKGQMIVNIGRILLYDSGGCAAKRHLGGGWQTDYLL